MGTNYNAKVLIRLDRIKKTGEAPVCIRLTKDRESTYKTLFSIKPEYWDEKKQLVKKKHPNAAERNSLIAQKLAEINKEAYLEVSSTDEHGVAAIRRKLHSNTSLDFFKYVDNCLADLERKGNVSLYRRDKAVFNKLRNFLQKETLPINNLTKSLMQEYEIYLIKNLNNQQNTTVGNLKRISKYARDIYAAYNLDMNRFPFRDYKMPLKKTTREYLTEEEVLRICSFKFKPKHPLYDAQMLFIFECYTGIRISDILTLKWKNYNIKESTISFVMRKTKTHLVIPLTGTANGIILRHRKGYVLRLGENINPEDYIFRILKQDVEKMHPQDAHNMISSTTAIINKTLKRLAIRLKISKNLSTHVARHLNSSFFLKTSHLQAHFS